MNVLFFVIPIALALGLFFLTSFIMAIKSGQFEDLDTPAIRMLTDDPTIKRENDHAE